MVSTIDICPVRNDQGTQLPDIQNNPGRHDAGGGHGFIEVRTEDFWESITSDGFGSRQRFYPWPGIDISSSLCQSCSASDKVIAMLPCVHEGLYAKLRPAGAVQDHMC